MRRFRNSVCLLPAAVLLVASPPGAAVFAGPAEVAEAPQARPAGPEDLAAEQALQKKKRAAALAALLAWCGIVVAGAALLGWAVWYGQRLRDALSRRPRRETAVDPLWHLKRRVPPSPSSADDSPHSDD
jgi:hypothetical protein